MLRTIRLTLAIVFFAIITLLFLDFSGTLHGIIRKTKRCGFPKRKVSKIRKFQKRNVFYLFKHTKGRENQNNPFPCLLFYTFNSNRTSSLPPIRLIVLSMLFS